MITFQRLRNGTFIAETVTPVMTTLKVYEQEK